MNNPSPFIPQGSLVEQKNKGRARVKIAVFFVLAVHGVGLLALLMQGCRRDDKEAAAGTDSATNVMETVSSFAPTNPVVDTNPVTTTPTATVEHVVIPPAPSATEYVIAKGDNYSTLALKFKVSARAIADANPGVDATKLQIGQKIKIPPPTPTASSSPGATAPPLTANGEQIYVVKSGDTLTMIASHNHTTVKALRSANNLKTDAIKVGQKLVIPGKSGAEPAPGTAAPPGGGAR